MDSNVLSVLITARNLIAKPENWCQGVFMDETDDGTISYCARGAIYAALRSDPYDKHSDNDHRHCQELVQAIPQAWMARYLLIRATESVAHYNNSHQHQNVLTLFDDTIARLIREQTIKDEPTASELEAA